MPTATLTAPTAALAFTLTAADRCDACGARAYVAVGIAVTKDGKPATTELLFCGHHFDDHEPALAASPLTRGIKNERALLHKEEQVRTRE